MDRTQTRFDNLKTHSYFVFQAEFERKKERMRVAKEVAKKFLDVAKKSTNTGPNEDLDPEFKKVSQDQ